MNHEEIRVLSPDKRCGRTRKPSLAPAFRQHAEDPLPALLGVSGLESLRERLEDLLANLREIEEMRAEADDIGGGGEARRLADEAMKRASSVCFAHASELTRILSLPRAEERAAANREAKGRLDDLVRSPAEKRKGRKGGDLR